MNLALLIFVLKLVVSPVLSFIRLNEPTVRSCLYFSGFLVCNYAQSHSIGTHR